MARKIYICTQCGFVGYPSSGVRGSFLIELILWVLGLGFTFFLSWLFLLIPIFYSIYRLGGRYKECPQCHLHNTMIPLDSPRGRQLYAQLNNGHDPSNFYHL